MGRITAFFKMVFSRTSWRMWWSGSSKVDYLSKVGDGTGSSVVTAPLFWIARTFPEAPPALWQLIGKQEEQIMDHPMLRLLVKPNEYYTGQQLWQGTVVDYQVDGNAYWLKVRDRGLAVRELWWTPSWLINPVGDENDFITHYEYRPGGQQVDLRVEDVVHFRFGMDTNDPKLGMSPLKSVLREVYTDDEAATFTAALLGNMGVPGLMLSPAKGVTIKEEDAKEAKADLLTKFTGDRRGEPLVMTGASEIQQFGFSPEQLLLRELRRIPEERTTAVLGVPAIVAGLGAGLERSTFTNMAEAREAAYESGIIPMQRSLGEDVRWQLLGDFEPDPFMWRFGFDLSKVRVLQEDLYRQAQRLSLGVVNGWATVAEARQPMGLDVRPQDRIYLRSVNVVERAEGTVAPEPVVPANPVPSNGNGRAEHLTADEIATAVVAAIERDALIRG